MAAVSAVVSVPLLRAMTTGTGVWFTPWNGVASRAACRLGLLAGRELVLLCLATLVSEGKNRLARTAAATQATTIAHRKRTANRPVAAKNLCMVKLPGLSGGTGEGAGCGRGGPGRAVGGASMAGCGRRVAATSLADRCRWD